jgi:hypothetical protein
MALLYADEDFHYAVVERLRHLGHDVRTVQEAGRKGGERGGKKGGEIRSIRDALAPEAQASIETLIGPEKSENLFRGSSSSRTTASSWIPGKSRILKTITPDQWKRISGCRMGTPTAS